MTFSRVLRQAIRLSFEDQACLIECLKQQLETTSHDPVETFSSSTHSAEVQPGMQEQVTDLEKRYDDDRIARERK